ncbi:MAG TPA: glycine cleavage system aminomethyltransferase GcvT [Candidatus Avacidaminococcus intestinavium]|uniref:Aminomethyltransferase n=1 Tax=Candidatus Avacidaminococcus intestinavium TaxID=2840684 RepID=A0A9D1SLK5_9FIRM|nr:glycine cleavage system aminomethyltransferase GcvT [Candidatus Avacidaminococcus intestinavium]
MKGKKTPLYETHVALGGKIVEFGGWQMPVQYSGIIEEHNTVRNKVGLFDVSHMGEIWVEGKEALDYLQHLLTNDIAIMREGETKYSPMCNFEGGTIDDLLVYKFNEELYLLVVNAANIEKDYAWMEQNIAKFEVTISNKSDEIGQVALQGPNATAVLSKLVPAEVTTLKYYHFIPGVLINGKKTLISRTGYTGEDGYEIYCMAEDVTTLWAELMEAGQEYGILPAGLGARDTLRFEACLPLYGHELSETITPLMAGIGFAVKLDKADFIGKAALKKQKTEGLKQKVMGAEITGRGIARAEYPVKAAGEVIGYVTTGSPAPTLGKNMALVLVQAACAEIGKAITVEIRGKEVDAVLVGKPFYKRK